VPAKVGAGWTARMYQGKAPIGSVGAFSFLNKERKNIRKLFDAALRCVASFAT
jgi:hypothetical protein